jgi:hypothetical protein
MTKLLNGDDPDFEEISPMITTLRHDLDQKIKRLADALGTLSVAATELEKVRIALQGTAPGALVSATAHDTCIPLPAQAVMVAKKHEIMRVMETVDNLSDAVREGVEGVLGSASLPENDAEGRADGAARIRLPQLLQARRNFSPPTRASSSARFVRRTNLAATLRPAFAKWLPN